MNSVPTDISANVAYTTKATLGGIITPIPPAAATKMCIRDSVKGGSKLTVYLNTPYTVEYHLSGPASAPEDNKIYIACKALDKFPSLDFSDLTPDSPIEDRNEGKKGGWVSNALHTTVTLQNVPTGYTGWYTTCLLYTSRCV